MTALATAGASQPGTSGLPRNGQDDPGRVLRHRDRRRRSARRGVQAACGGGRPGHPVRLAITPGQIELTAGSGDEADGTDVVGCELDGDPITVAFHPHRLLDALTAVGTGRARLALTAPARAALLTPADGGQDDDATGYRHLLMPIRCAG